MGVVGNDTVWRLRTTTSGVLRHYLHLPPLADVVDGVDLPRERKRVLMGATADQIVWIQFCWQICNSRGPERPYCIYGCHRYLQDASEEQ